MLVWAQARRPARFRGSRTRGRRVGRRHTGHGYFVADVSMQPPGGPPSRDTSYDRPNQNCQEKDDAKGGRGQREGPIGRKKGDGEMGIAAQNRDSAARKEETKTSVALPRGRIRGRWWKKRILSGEWDTIAAEIYSSDRNCFRDEHVRQVEEESRWAHHLRSRDPLSKTASRITRRLDCQRINESRLPCLMSTIGRAKVAMISQN